MNVITCIEDLRQIYHRKVPKLFVDYVESGSWTEQTLHENTNDFRLIRLQQKVARDISKRNLATTMMGQDVTIPVGLAPVGLCGMQSADGEIKAACAAKSFGVPFTLSTMSICSIEDVAKYAYKGFWFQLYVMRDEDFVHRLIGRAKDAECSVLVLTLDLQILGQRHKDLKNGLSTPIRPTLRNCVDLATKVPWIFGMLGTKRHRFGNVVGHVNGVSDTRSLMRWVSEQFEPSLDWSRVAAIKREWGGPMILKGILNAEDARKAVDVGSDGIIVSNHGGRQLDGALSSIRSLQSIVDVVGSKTEVYLDSGIRSGQDVLKAMALGACGTMIGRAYIYGLGALGEAGVVTALETIRKELDSTMGLCGVCDVIEFGMDNIHLPERFYSNW